MAQQLKKISCENLTTARPQNISIKNETDNVVFSEADTQTQDNSEILYTRRRHAYKPASPPHFTRSSSTNNGRGRPHNYNRYPNRNFSNSQTPICYVCGCKFHYAKKCPYSQNNHHSRENMVLLNEHKNDISGSCEDITNIVLLNRRESENSLFGETINCAILDSGASATVCGKKWLDCFLETLSEDSKKDILYDEGTKYFKFGDGMKIKSLQKVTLPCVIAKMNI